MDAEKVHVLTRRFPRAYGPTESELYFPYPKSLTRFLRHMFPDSSNARDVIYGIVQFLDFDGGEVAVVSDERLADAIGIDRRSLRRVISDPWFGNLVAVTRGKVWAGGEERRATKYDLFGLMAAWKNFRKIEAFNTEKGGN